MSNITLHTNRFSGLTALPPLSLYIHIPWCIRKCPYCDFNSHQAKNGLPEQEYIDALLLDLQTELPNVWGRPIETVFIGGGTPSLFSAEAISRLISGVRALLPVQPQAEITLEANPGTFEQEKFAGYRDAGITRLSIGVQSFQTSLLSRIGRIHNGDEAHHAVAQAVKLFERVNVDLMYALPNQTPEQAIEDVHTAASLGVGHISAYHLTMEPNTPFGHTPPKNLPTDEAAEVIEEAVHHTLQSAGFIHYETSAFSQPNQACRHNLNYWQFGDYIGIGAGAHGKISYPDRIERTTRKRHPNDYLTTITQNPINAATRQTVRPSELPFEFMLNTLRLSDGVPSAWLEERTGIPLAIIAQPLQKAVALDLIDPNPAHLQPTAKGKAFLNDLLELFL